MRLLLIGAPGAGKGTQAELLAERFGISHISSGDLLRQHVKDRTSIGQMIKSYLDHGDLVPNGVVMDMLRKPVVAAAQAGGYVLDGFPRTVEQAKASFPTAHALGVEVQVAVHLDVTRTELVRRLLARRRGAEDTEAVIERRLQVYLDKTVPLLEYYADREWMFTVDGAQSPDAVHRDIVACLQGADGLRCADPARPATGGRSGDADPAAVRRDDHGGPAYRQLTRPAGDQGHGGCHVPPDAQRIPGWTRLTLADPQAHTFICAAAASDITFMRA
jgi:adenylate kinase